MSHTTLPVQIKHALGYSGSYVFAWRLYTQIRLLERKKSVFVQRKAWMSCEGKWPKTGSSGLIWILSRVLRWCRGPVSVTGLRGVAGDASVELHLLFGPGDDVTPEVAAAGSQAVDVAGCQHVWPHVEVRHLPHEGLGGVEAAPQGVLRKTERSGVSLASKAEASSAGSWATFTCSCPRMKTPPGLTGCQGERLFPDPLCTPSWYASHCPSRVDQVTQTWCHFPSLRDKGSVTAWLGGGG